VGEREYREREVIFIQDQHRSELEYVAHIEEKLAGATGEKAEWLVEETARVKARCVELEENLAEASVALRDFAPGQPELQAGEPLEELLADRLLATSPAMGGKDSTRRERTRGGPALRWR
jgi:DNA repair exonuclease SbcCD ATPase subunit